MDTLYVNVYLEARFEREEVVRKRLITRQYGYLY